MLEYRRKIALQNNCSFRPSLRPMFQLLSRVVFRNIILRFLPILTEITNFEMWFVSQLEFFLISTSKLQQTFGKWSRSTAIEIISWFACVVIFLSDRRWFARWEIFPFFLLSRFMNDWVTEIILVLMKLMNRLRLIYSLYSYCTYTMFLHQ